MWNSAAANFQTLCKGVWIARYPKSHASTSCVPPMDWDDALVSPQVAMNCATLAWQYVGDCYGTPNMDGVLDGNQVNPNINLNADLLDHLILPPQQ